MIGSHYNRKSRENTCQKCALCSTQLQLVNILSSSNQSCIKQPRQVHENAMDLPSASQFVSKKIKTLHLSPFVIKLCNNNQQNNIVLCRNEYIKGGLLRPMIPASVSLSVTRLHATSLRKHGCLSDEDCWGPKKHRIRLRSWSEDRPLRREGNSMRTSPNYFGHFQF